MKKLTVAKLNYRIRKLEQLNEVYHRDGFTKFIDDEITRLRGLIIDWTLYKEKKDSDRSRRRKKT